MESSKKKKKNICPKFILDKIMAIPISQFKRIDETRWDHTKEGNFTLKSAYNWILTKDKNYINPNLPWKYIWNLKVYPRIKFFLWQLAHNGIPNANFLYQRKIINNNL